MQKALIGFVKTGKQNETRWTSCLTRVIIHWAVQHRNSFAHLNYLSTSESFYRKVITIVRLTTILSHCRIAIQKLNNIIINMLTNPRLSVLPNKWWFDTSQDLEILGDDIDSVSLETILDNILRAHSFNRFSLDYLKKGAPRFVDSTNEPKLVIEPEDNNQPITNSEDEKARKWLNWAAKRKAQCNNLRIHM